MALLILASLLLATVTAAQQYTLDSSFAGTDGLAFFDNFDFWTSWDPTFGYVHYVDQTTALQYQMINVTNSTVSWGVDTTQVLDPTANLGRLSIRLTSLKRWTHGLFVLDLEHMPSSTCGVWPAAWTLGSGTWPQNGEIDIIEYFNDAANNLNALHTSDGCSIAGADMTGSLLSNNCSGGTGCSVSDNAANNQGNAFNANGGGIYAMEWTSAFIRMWFFPRNAIPESLLSTTGDVGDVGPDVSTFGQPVANFEGDCDIDAHFQDHHLVMNIDFCGQTSGNLFQSQGCPMLDPTNSWQSCNDFVALNPQAFVDTYWEVNYIRVYQQTAGLVPTPSSALSSVTPTSSTISVSNALGRSTTPSGSLAALSPTSTASSVISELSSLSASEASSSSSIPASGSPTIAYVTVVETQTVIVPWPSQKQAALQQAKRAMHTHYHPAEAPQISALPITPYPYRSLSATGTSLPPAVSQTASTVESNAHATTTSPPIDTADFCEDNDHHCKHSQGMHKLHYPTIECANVEGPMSAWTTSYPDVAWLILVCAVATPGAVIIENWLPMQGRFAATPGPGMGPVPTVGVEDLAAADTTPFVLVKGGGLTARDRGKRVLRMAPPEEHEPEGATGSQVVPCSYLSLLAVAVAAALSTVALL